MLKTVVPVLYSMKFRVKYSMKFSRNDGKLFLMLIQKNKNWKTSCSMVIPWIIPHGILRSLHGVFISFCQREKFSMKLPCSISHEILWNMETPWKTSYVFAHMEFTEYKTGTYILQHRHNRHNL